MSLRGWLIEERGAPRWGQNPKPVMTFQSIYVSSSASAQTLHTYTIPEGRWAELRHVYLRSDVPAAGTVHLYMQINDPSGNAVVRISLLSVAAGEAKPGAISLASRIIVPEGYTIVAGASNNTGGTVYMQFSYQLVEFDAP